MAFHSRADDGLTVKGRRQKGKFVREVVREIVVSGKDITSVAQPLFVIDRQDSNLQSFRGRTRSTTSACLAPRASVQTPLLQNTFTGESVAVPALIVPEYARVLA